MSWTERVTKTSHALEVPPKTFSQKDPKKIAQILKASAKDKRTPYRSALSLLIFYINRAGTKLPKAQRTILEKAKIELKKLYKK